MGLTCLKVQDNLSAWLDGELAPAVLALVERHLEGCADCSRELARLEALEQALEAWPAPAAPPGLPEKVRARLRRPPRRWWQSLALAASLILGIFVGGALTQNFFPLSQENGAGTEVASLEAFQDFPQGSLGMVLASYQEDEGNGNAK